MKSTRPSARSAAAPAVNLRIGRRVHDLRTRGSWSLDALSARSGVSRSMLSLIERGESSPTAVVLERIAAALNEPLAALFSDPDAAPNPISRALDRTAWKDPQSGYVRRNLSPSGFAAGLQLVDVVLPAGAQVTYESGPRDVPMEQQIWVQEGTLEVKVGGTTHRLQPDDCLAMVLDAPTQFRNPTRQRTRYLVALASDRVRGARR